MARSLSPRRCFLLAAVLLASTVSLAPGASAAITNGTFEAGSGCMPTGWTGYFWSAGAGVCRQSDSSAHSGTWVVRIDDSADFATGLHSECVATGAGAVWEARLWYRGTAGTLPETYSDLYLEFMNADQSTRVGVAFVSHQVGAVWAEQVVSATAPAGSACVRLLAYAHVAARGTYVIDDAQLIGDGVPPHRPACADGIDNDLDGKTDYPADPGCSWEGDTSESPDPQVPPPPAECSDGQDNDGDGWTDYPNDPGCASLSDTTESPDPPECSDGRDNDNDGFTDNDDPACTSPHAREHDDPRCRDEIDNDGDGRKDYPQDFGCQSVWDTTEDPDPQCGDFVNNDGSEDDHVDHPDDAGCSSKYDDSEGPNPQCADGVDNDFDLLVDVQDPDCNGDRRGATEFPECSDGADNDGNGRWDHASVSSNPDPYCASPTDDREAPEGGGGGGPVTQCTGANRIEICKPPAE